MYVKSDRILCSIKITCDWNSFGVIVFCLYMFLNFMLKTFSIERGNLCVVQSQSCVVHTNRHSKL